MLMLRKILIVLAVDWFNELLHPLPIDLDYADDAAWREVVDSMSFDEKLLDVLAWLFGGFGGAWMALRVCDWKWAGWGVVVVVLGYALFFISGAPYPLWMKICAVALPLLGGVIAVRLHHKPYPGEPLLG